VMPFTTFTCIDTGGQACSAKGICRLLKLFRRDVSSRAPRAVARSRAVSSFFGLEFDYLLLRLLTLFPLMPDAKWGAGRSAFAAEQTLRERPDFTILTSLPDIV